MSPLDTLKADAAKILQATTVANAPAALAKHLLMRKHRPQLLALAKLLLSTMTPKREKPKPASRRRQGPHRKHQQEQSPVPAFEERSLVPTPEQKLGALIARSGIADQDVFDHKLRGGKKLGEIRVHELPKLVEASAYSATAMLQRGYEDTVDTFLCAALGDHCVPTDPFSLVRDTIKRSEAEKHLAHAKIRAAEVLRDKSDLLAKELIALAHERGGAELHP